MRINSLLLSFLCFVSCSEHGRKAEFHGSNEKKVSKESIILQSSENKLREIKLDSDKKAILEQFISLSKQSMFPEFLKYMGVIFSDKSQAAYSPQTGVISLKGDNYFIDQVKECIAHFNQKGLDEFRKQIEDENKYPEF